MRFVGDPRFLEMANRVRRAAHLQLVVTPYSSVHENETYLWRGHQDLTAEQLMDFIKRTSRGAKFERDYAVELTQVLNAFESYLSGAGPSYDPKRPEAVEGDLAAWDDYFFVDVGGYRRDIELSRRLKADAVNTMINALDSWQASTSTFDQDVDLEYSDAGRLYFDYYWKKVRRIAAGDWSAMLDAPIRSQVIEQMLRCLPTDMEVGDQVRTCSNFFASEHFKNVPLHWISARIFATLKSMVRRGTYANRDHARRRLSGIFSDIEHISTYAPYCDAIVLDTPMAELVGLPTVAIERRFGVKVFSLSNWDAFQAWLGGLEVAMSNEHRAAVAAAYPGGDSV